MRVAICGYPPLALQVQEGLKNTDIEFKFFIHDFVSSRVGGGELLTNLPPINFFEFRRLVNAGELDGVIVAEEDVNPFTKNVIQACKLYGVPKVGIADLINFNIFNPVYILDPDKAYLPYLETNLIDSCNLNCKGCTHFSSLFKQSEIYSVEAFRRDIRRLSQTCDVQRFRLLGGEPLLLKNLDEYIKIAREYFPQTNLRIVTNGLLIPSTSQKILDVIRLNNCFIDVSVYAPTSTVLNKIENILITNRIKFHFEDSVKDKFHALLTLHAGNNPTKSRSGCFNDICRILRDGKIYKCPIDALKFRLAERFKFKNFPAATGVDIYAQNFSLLLSMLDGNVEMCSWCSERTREFPWATSSKPKLEDWLADPTEVKNFQ